MPARIDFCAGPSPISHSHNCGSTMIVDAMAVGGEDDDNNNNASSSSNMGDDNMTDHEGSHFDPVMNQDKKDELRHITNLAQKETRNLWLWKLALLSLMLVTAGLVSAGTYIFIHDAQEKDFKDSVRPICIVLCFVFVSSLSFRSCWLAPFSHRFLFVFCLSS
jgi:hypothetical protein